jgi:hypothetical protein
MSHSTLSSVGGRISSHAGYRTWETVSHLNSLKRTDGTNLNQIIACYFNSLLQMLYTVPSLVRAILTADIKLEEEKKESDSKNGSSGIDS